MMTVVIKAVPPCSPIPDIAVGSTYESRDTFNAVPCKISGMIGCR
jgi:hypothetical protein